MATILQSPLLTDFLYPFLLLFFIVFAILEKTNILGKEKKQINAMVAMVVGLIFVGAVFPKIFAENLMLFLSVAMVIVFVGLMLWGFLTGEGSFTIEGGKKMHLVFVWIFALGLFFGILWAAGITGKFFTGLQNFLLFLFNSSWSGTFWTNVLFILLIAVAVAIAIGWNPFRSSWFIQVK